MSVSAALLRLLGLEAATKGQRLFSEELYGIRPGASIAPRGDSGAASDPQAKPYRMVAEGIAEVRIEGVLSKRPDLWRFLGLSAQQTLPEMAAAVRAAAEDTNVKGILLGVDSPGGSVLGTLEVAQAVAAANAAKPVHAYGRDDCASCAYWIASQARRLTTNAVAHVGAIGVYSVLVDASQEAEDFGYRFIVVKSGEFKGAGIAEAGITDEQIAYFQGLVNDCNAEFMAAVTSGRGSRLKGEIAALADGRCHVGQKAAALGLSDGVGTYAEALAALIAEVGSVADTRPEEPVTTDLPPEDAEPDELPEQPAAQETQMSQANTKPEPTGEADKERSFVRRLMGLLQQTEPPAEPEPEPEPKPDIAAMVAAEVRKLNAASLVENDLRGLEGKATPAAIAAFKPVLLAAKSEGRDEEYAAILKGMGASDASALLGGPIADDKQAGQALAPVAGLPREDVEFLNEIGIKPERVAALGKKFQVNDYFGRMASRGN